MTLQFEQINATNALVAFCDQAGDKDWLAVDTEFVRTRTYYANLGLVQLATEEACAVVDPLQVEDMSCLWELLSEQRRTTVMHAAGEDIEILRQKNSEAPSQLFDTQIAWSFLSQGDQIGYAGLIEHHFGVELDKSLSRTDWLARPLSAAQLQYAAADTYYLAKVYPELKAQLEQSKWADIFQQECDFQLSKRSRTANPDYAWKDIGIYSQLNGQQRAVFASVAKWRLQTAQKENIAVPFLLKDPALAEISRMQPTNKRKLAEVEGVHPSVLRKRGQAILDAVAEGLEQAESDWPPAIPRLDDHSGYKSWFKAAKKLVNERANEVSVAPSMLGSRKQINEVFVWSCFVPDELKSKLFKPELLESWRSDVAGKELLELANDLR
ncbi:MULTISPECIES: ribonuclease D [Gammaproteobacteria]|uniref:ribonuclease D n=1 Tax=Gammaproteobacteria TaxID=1236 RepID=UPI000DD04D96|nr:MULTISPECIES: ribonuclease D [Gammaproteobacteria]RTE87605.1 ribonuclease D [Aliidiomarina sp. B3213]TCZ92610.1 ribonuclease D [Lysobacter sp. N42]